MRHIGSKAEIHEYILKNWRIVKVATTKAQRKLFFNLRSAKKTFNWLDPQETLAIANDLGVSSEEVSRMEGRLSTSDLAFDGAAESEEERVFCASLLFGFRCTKSCGSL